MIRVGDQIPLQLQLFDGSAAKFPRAVVRNAAGTAISGSPFALTHVADGHYSNLTAVMPNTPFVTIQTIVYSDAGFTTVDTGYSYDLDIQDLDVSAPASTALDNTVWTNAKAAFVDVAISSRNAVAPDNTSITAIKAKTDNLPASPANEVTSAAIKAKTDNLPASPANEVTSAAIKAKTDNLPADPADNSDILAAIAAIPTSPTVGQIADAVWDEPLAGHVGVGSTGEKLSQGATVNVQDIVDGVWDEPIASHLGAGSTGEKLSTGGSGGGGGSAPPDLIGQLKDDDDRLIGTINDSTEL